ncbi:MAG: hypothetical protein JOZ24_05880 [Candidatus Eremiobacteraeota bacterium]|nr:hypothetical protein [Candidatus Eremiobacteraeota bacterium]
MPSDFTDVAHRTYAEISVPPAPTLSAIRMRAQRRDKAEVRARLAVVSAVLLAVSVGFASGAGAAISQQIRLWLSGSHGAAAVVHGLAFTNYPTREEIVDVTQRAAFPVVLPVGLPAQDRLIRIVSSPGDRPVVVMLMYRTPSGNGFTVLLADSASISHGAPPAGVPTSGPFTTITVGRETVLIRSDAAHAWLARTLRTGMQDATTQTSLAAVAPQLVTGIALDPHQIAQMPVLARKGKPLLDNRTVVLSDIPLVDGGPDYMHAKMTWPRRIALQPGAVREVAAYLRTHGSQHALLYVPDAPAAERVRPLR